MSELQVGPYKVDRSQNSLKGCNGTVYISSVQRESSEEKVALKEIIIPPGQPTTKAQVVEKVKAQKENLTDPCFLKIIDVIEHENAAWIVSEHCDRGNLEDFMLRRRPKLDKQINVMISCAKAAKFLHSLTPPIVHGNIKPQNILFKSEEEGVVRVKLADTSLPSILNITYGSSNADFSQLFVAPEFLAQKEVTQAADIFSLGLVYHAMLSFKGSDERLLALSETGLEQNKIRSIAQDMYEAKLRSAKTEEVCYSTPLDTRYVKNVKNVVNGMLACEPPQRSSLATVISQLEQILSEVVSSGDGKKKKQKSAKQAASKTPQSEAMDSHVPEGQDNDGEDEARPLPKLTYKFHLGEKVRLSTDFEFVKSSQESKTSWENSMEKYLGEQGNIIQVRSRAVKVGFPDGKSFYFNPATLAKASDEDSYALEATQLQKRLKIKRLDIVKTKSHIDAKSLKRKNKDVWKGGDIEKIMGVRGVAHECNEDGVVTVEFCDGHRGDIHQECLEAINDDRGDIKEDDIVLITADRNFAINTQSTSCGWVGCMENCLEKSGTVRRVIGSDIVEVRISSTGPKFMWSKSCVRLAAKSDVLKKRRSTRRN